MLARVGRALHSSQYTSQNPTIVTVLGRQVLRLNDSISGKSQALPNLRLLIPTRRTLKDMANGAYDDSVNQHPYKGRRHSITRPDWPAKHDTDPRTRNLLPYIQRPEEYADRILRNTPDVVLIKDKYPKGQIHFLMIPKWFPHRDLHPHDAFEDPDFLSMVRSEAEEALKIAAPMLKAKMEDALLKDGTDIAQATTILQNRDFFKDFQIGIHAHPSQHELHVHVKSRDMVSRHNYGPRHYQAFNTPFLVPLDLYPLPRKDINREVKFQNANLQKEDFQCWRCGKDYGTSWEGMKEHLREEYLAWIREDTNSTDATSKGDTVPTINS